MQAGRGGEQRGGAGRCGGREDLFGALDLAFLIEIRRHQPLVQVERVAGGGEDGAAIDDAECAVHTQAEAFEHGGEMPGVNRLAVGGGLVADGVEPDAVQKRRQQRMTGERLVEPGEGAGGARQCASECGIQWRWLYPEKVMHGRHLYGRWRGHLAILSDTIQGHYGEPKPNTPKKVVRFAASQSAGAAPIRPAMTDRSSVASLSNRTTEGTLRPVPVVAARGAISGPVR